MEQQRRNKVTQLTGLLPDSFRSTPITWLDCGQDRLRDRVDLTIVNGHVGLFDVDRKGLVDLQNCPMMSIELEKWFLDFRKDLPAIKKGSVRLRVSPAGERGVWLDLANEDVKNLFEEKTYLQRLLKKAFVEIGQRRKNLHDDGERLRLGDPAPQKWLETYDQGDRAIPLYSVVGGFSQTGFRANKLLVGEVLRLVQMSGRQAWLELFSGSGNFSVALAASGYSVSAVEVDELAVSCLQLTVSQDQARLKNLTVEKSDVYRLKIEFNFKPFDGILFDPPRSGLGALLNVMEANAADLPKSLIYVSCFGESLAQDLQRLRALGYSITSITGVDQFPHSPHCEWVVALDRN